MRLKYLLPVVAALVLAAAAATLTASLAVSAIENKSQTEVARVLDVNGFGWAKLSVDGLQVHLSGEAPDEATRFKALSAAGSVIDSARVIDNMDVTAAGQIVPPTFSVEILRNEDGISLIGLIPASMDRAGIVDAIASLSKGASVTDLLESADYPAPEGWDAAVTYGLDALAKLERSKISITASRVALKAISDSPAEKRKLEADLARKAPDGLEVAIDITAPRPVITPYTLRFLIDEDGARFDACSTDTAAGREVILRAARDAGMTGKGSCTIGLGIPSPDWDKAVVIAIGKLAELGGGSITFSDADVTLVAPDTTPQSRFDQIMGELEGTLPDLFSVHAILPAPVKIDGTGEGSGPPEFVATRSPEGNVLLRGRIPNSRARVAAESYAQAQFGSKVVTGTMRLDDSLPRGWSTRVLASIEALSHLNSGSVVMQADVVEIKGVTGDPEARADVSRLLSQKLGEAENFHLNITYEEKLDPLLGLPTPEECVQNINDILKVRQITFAPGSADIDTDARDTIDKIVGAMEHCQDVPMEIGGYTDSQGRETMNQALSQSRAEAVITALLGRRVLTGNLVAKGYGEAEPIGDNDTEAGRETNRRIEFKLILPDNETTPAGETQADAAAPVDEPVAAAPVDGQAGGDGSEAPAD